MDINITRFQYIKSCHRYSVVNIRTSPPVL